MNRKIIPLLLTICLLFTACAREPEQTVTTTSQKVTTTVTTASMAVQTTTTTVPPTTTTTEPPNVVIKIAAVGDNLLHNSVSMDCKTSDSFDFTKLYSNVKPIMEEQDIAFINQEVMLTGEVNNYPCMSAPFEVADALLESGFNVVNLATNHTMDMGKTGLLKSIRCFNERDFEAVLGAFETEEDANTPIILEKQGIKIGMLSYTYGLNGFKLPSDMPWIAALIDEEKMQADMEKLRPLCDLLVVSMHWGEEYSHTPSAEQRYLAEKLCLWGADVIIGTHPHVLQPVEIITDENGHSCFCAYSLGNFVSGQTRRARMLGGLLQLEIEMTHKGEIVSVSGGVLPLVTHYIGGQKEYQIMSLWDYTDELGAEHGVNAKDGQMTVKWLSDLAEKVLGEYMLRG